jgi:hypothetical protein
MQAAGSFWLSIGACRSLPSHGGPLARCWPYPGEFEKRRQLVPHSRIGLAIGAVEKVCCSQ